MLTVEITNVSGVPDVEVVVADEAENREPQGQRERPALRLVKSDDLTAADSDVVEGGV